MVQPVGNQTQSHGLALASTTIDVQQSIKNAATEVTESAKSDFQPGADKQNQAGISQPLANTLEQMNDSLQAWSTGLKFEIDDDLGRVVVSIIDAKSGDVLRKVPSETVLKVAKMIVQMQGSSINTRA